MKKAWLSSISRHPWITLLLVVVVAFAASYGGKNLYFRGDYKVFFDKDFPQLLAHEEMQRIFNKNDNVSIIVVPKEGSVFNQEMLAQIKQLTDEAWQTPFSSRVDSITNYQHTWAEEDDLVVEDLILELDVIDQQLVERTQAISTVEPNLVHSLVSPDGKVAVVNITIQLPDKENNTAEVIQVTEFAKQLTDSFAEKYQSANNFLYLGRQYNFPTALEGALKLKEISYIHAEGYPAAEMKHGPIALVDEQTPSVFVMPRGFIYEKVMSNLEESKARGGPIIAVAFEGDERIAEVADDVIYVPPVDEFLQPVVTVIPLQLIAYHIAVLRGCDVDKPRNLAKSVTVE